MTAAFKRLLDEPGNDMIVIPFHHNFYLTGFVPIRTEEHFYFIARSHYDPEHYPPGSCIQ